MAFIIVKFDSKLPHATPPTATCAHGRIRRAEPTREANCWVVVYFDGMFSSFARIRMDLT